MTQSVFISGATSGIGLATARLLDKQGWRVFAAALPTDDFAPLVDSTSNMLVPLEIDITNADTINAAVDDINQNIGEDGLQGIINNAGIQVAGALETLSIDDLRAQFEVNLFGHFHVIQACLPLLRQSQGRIINVSSMMGKVALPVLGAYSMSKYALEAMSDVLRLELAPDGIKVSVIEPGAIQTPMTASMETLLDTRFKALSVEMQQRYQALYHAMRDVTVQQAASAITAEQVAEVIYQALTSNNPKPRYAITPAVKGLIAMRQFSPDEVGDAILKRVLKLP